MLADASIVWQAAPRRPVGPRQTGRRTAGKFDGTEGPNQNRMESGRWPGPGNAHLRCGPRLAVQAGWRPDGPRPPNEPGAVLGVDARFNRPGRPRDSNQKNSPDAANPASGTGYERRWIRTSDFHRVSRAASTDIPAGYRVTLLILLMLRNVCKDSVPDSVPPVRPSSLPLEWVPPGLPCPIVPTPAGSRRGTGHHASAGHGSRPRAGRRRRASQALSGHATIPITAPSTGPTQPGWCRFPLTSRRRRLPCPRLPPCHSGNDRCNSAGSTTASGPTRPQRSSRSSRCAGAELLVDAATAPGLRRCVYLSLGYPEPFYLAVGDVQICRPTASGLYEVWLEVRHALPRLRPQGACPQGGPPLRPRRSGTPRRHLDISGGGTRVDVAAQVRVEPEVKHRSSGTEEPAAMTGVRPGESLTLDDSTSPPSRSVSDADRPGECRGQAARSSHP